MERGSIMTEFDLFESIKNGLEEAIEFNNGDLKKAKTRKVKIEPIPHFTSTEIKDIRLKANLSQSALANFMGVSKKTIEAWEAGTNIPQGSSQRLLEIVSRDMSIINQYIEQ
jgi:putative transcriptional regulator